MNCPKCGFVSFDHLDTCKNCGKNLLKHKARLGIKSFPKKEASTLVQDMDDQEEPLRPKNNETTVETESSDTKTGMQKNNQFSLDDISFEDSGDETGISDNMQEFSGEDDESCFEEVGEAFVRHEAEEGLDSNLHDIEEDSLQIPLAFVERNELSGKKEELELRACDKESPAIVDRTIFFKRGLAFGLDWTILLLTLCLFPYLGLLILKSKALISTATLTIGIIRTKLPVPTIFLTLVISAAYFSFFHGTTGQTPGKMLFNLKVVGQDNRAVGMDKAFLRWFGYVASALPIMGGFLMALMDKKGQALHDKIAGTFVVATSPQALAEEDAGELPLEEGSK